MIKIAQTAKSIAEAIEQGHSKDIKVLLKNLSKEQHECCVNDTRVAKALISHFDVAVANVLFKNGFSLFSCLSSRHSYQTGGLKYSILDNPSSDFWLYVCTPSRIKKSDLTVFANISVKMLAENHWSTSHPKRAALAEFRDILRQNHPKFFHEWANLESWDICQALFSSCNKNFCAQDWKFFNSLPSLFWKDTAHPADWSTQYMQQDIPAVLNVVKNVPNAQKALDKYYKFIEEGRQFAQQLSYSSTGKIDDIQLLDEINPLQSEKVLTSIKDLIVNDQPHAGLGVSDCEIFAQILLGDFSTDTDLWKNLSKKTKDKLLRSQTLCFASFFEMMITLGHTPHILNPSEVDIQKIFGSTAVVREIVEYYDQNLQWQDLIKTFPSLKKWQDAHGNTLGHWIASSPNANSFMDVLKDPAWLKPNKQGNYVRDILASTTSEEHLSKYDQYVNEQLARQEKRTLEKSLKGVHPSNFRRKM